MKNNDDNGTEKKYRNKIAIGTLFVSVGAITILSFVAILKDANNTMNIFNSVLPMFAAWVGTILAFYFGRENFESANQQVRALVQKLTPEERSKKPVTSIMRGLQNIVHFKIQQGETEKDIPIEKLLGKFSASTSISRLPIISHEDTPMYIIHESSINKYLAAGGKKEDSLENFISKQNSEGFNFGQNSGFIIVAEETTLYSAKQKMEAIPSCQDIFITKDGTSNKPLLGWISNIRLAKFLEV